MNTAPQRARRRTGSWTPEKRAEERDLLARLAELSADDPERARIRDELVVMHLPLVRHVAAKYRDRGEVFDDLVQVGTIGLIQSVDRFDVTRGTELSTFAAQNILGEIKRHFRDRAWLVRIPRRLQENHLAVSAATDRLTQELGRSPTVRELADATELTTEDVLDALEARHAFAATPLDAARDGDDASLTLAETLGAEDSALEALVDREALRPLLDALPDRERLIIGKRFFQNKSQSQIAQELGISQMHVSRLLARTLADLRAGLSSG